MVISDLLYEVDKTGIVRAIANEERVFIRKLRNGKYHVIVEINIHNVYELSKSGLIQFLYKTKAV